MAHFNVNLAFNADTGKAKAQIQELQTLLSKIAYTGTATNATGGMQKDLRSASEAAKELQFHLNNAFNTSTGNFDLSMLDRSLKTSGSNITKLSTQLLSAGKDGQQAFVALAQSISLADQPMLRISRRMQEFATTMKNTVKWQLSSSMLHGFMGAVQSAYGYAQDLNKSLNDIRIVTGYNTDRMAEFAEQANKAAKALSTTTNDYTEASLIYFQQGLTDAEVAARTDVTIKMANAAGVNAQVVSEQLTAVWNNFYDGSKSLEYYADVMTALGAATASSTDEISEGLSKFASIADTVGLSYEYATAALATVTAETRESADIVGNSFKAIFGRLEGLKMGDTLEDGVTLNKYSEALSKIGVSIFDSNGELKEMDTILEDLGARWEQLTKTQKVALAQTVGGTQQYARFIALMENWDKVQENLGIAYSSEGALQEQADIYAESWEAAQKRVRAAAEGIYQSLIDDKFFISLNNGFANLLKGIDAFIDGAGGVKTVLAGIASVFLSIFAHKIPDVIDNLKYNLTFLSKGMKDAYQDIQKQMDKATENAFIGFKDKKTGKQVEPIKKDSALGYQITAANELTAARSKLALVSDKMSASERQMANTQLNIIETAQAELIALKKKNEALSESIKLQQESIQKSEIDNSTKLRSEKTEIDILTLDKNVQKKYQEAVDIFNEARNAEEPPDNLGALSDEQQQLEFLTVEMMGFSASYEEAVAEINSAYGSLGQNIFDKFIAPGDLKLKEQIFEMPEWFMAAFNEVKSAVDFEGFLNDEFNFKTVQQQIAALSNTIPKAVQEAVGLDKIFKNLEKAKTGKEFTQEFKELEKKLESCKIKGEDFKDVLESLYGKGKIESLIGDMDKLVKKEAEAAGKANILKNLLNEFKPAHIVRTSEALGALGGMLSGVVTIANSFNSIISNLENPDLMGWEKFGAVLSGVGMIIPSVLSSLQSIGTVTAWTNVHLGISLALRKGLATTAMAQAASEKILAVAENAGLKQLTAKNLAQWAEIIAQKTGIKQDVVAINLENLLSGAKKRNAKAIMAKIIAMLTENTAEATGNKQRGIHIILQQIINALTGKFAGLWIAIAAIGIVAIIARIVSGLDALFISQKEANEAITEATTIYEEEKQKLDELNNSLKTTKERIAELKAQDSLTIIEESELKKLKEQEASLERQVALQKALVASRQREQIDTIEKYFEKSSGLTHEPTIIKGLGTYQQKHSYGGRVISDVEDLGTLDDYKTQVGYSDSIEWANTHTKEYKKIREWEAEIQKAHDEWLQKNAEQIQANEDNYTSYIQGLTDLEVDREKKASEIANMQAILQSQRKQVYGEDYEENILAPIINSNIENLSETDFANDDLDWGAIIGIKDLDLAGVAKDEFNTYMNSAIDIIQAKASELNLSKNINKQLAELDEKDLEILLKNLDAISAWDGSVPLKEFINGLDTSAENLQEKLNFVQELKSNLIEIFNITADLQIGNILSQEDYDLLIKYNTELEKYFMFTGKGYKYLGGADKNDFTMGIDSKIAEMQKYNDFYKIFDGYTYSGGDKKGQKIDWLDYYNTSGAQALTWLVNQNPEADWSLVGDGSYSVDKILSIADRMKSEDEATRTEGERQAQIFINAFNNTLAVGSASGSASQSELRYSVASNINELNKIHNEYEDEDAYSKGLENIAIQYEECEEALEEYRTAIQEYGRNSTQAKNATNQLKQSIKKVEWKKFTKDALQYAKALAEATNQEDVDDNLRGIKKSFEDNMGFEVSMDALRKYEKRFIEWGAAGEDASDDIATQLYSLLQLEENMENNPFEFYAEVDTSAAKSSFNDLVSFYDSVKSIVEANPPIVDAYGNADFSNMIAAMLEAGYTAADVAAALQSIGQTEVDFSAWGNGLPNVDFSDVDSIINFINALNNWKGDIEGETNAPITAEAIKNTFGGSLPAATGTGGGRHMADKNTGGGSSSKHSEKKSTSDKERYHTLQNQLEDLTNVYERMSEAADRAFGKDKLNAIDKEIAATDDLITKQEEYLDAISANLPVDKAVMDAYYNDVIGGPAIEYDENGNISNYDTIQDAMFDKYNEMADKYTSDSEEWQVFEKQYEQLEKYIEQYEETYDLLREEEAKYQELLNQRIDLQLEKVQYKVEIELAVSEDELAMIEYQMGKIEDDAFKSAEAVRLLAREAEAVYDQIQANKEGLNEALALSLSAAEIAALMAGDMSVLEDKTFTADQIDAIKEYRDNLLALNEQFMEIRQSIEEQVLNTFDAWHEKLDTGMTTLEHYQTILESYQNIIDIVGKDTLGISSDFMAQLSQAAVDNSIDQLKAAKSSYEAVATAQQEAQDALAEAQANGDEESISMWEETLITLNESAQEASEELMSAWEDALSGIVDAFDLALERTVEDFNDAVYSMGGIEGLLNAFESAQETSDLMLKDYEQIYELSKLSRDINNSIDDTDSLAGKQKLKKLLGEINKLQEDGVEMSKYDLEYLQAEYNLRLAEIELEEARNAKNTVRLQKDNEGNWSYIYTQNTDAVDEAQQKYEDALFAMQDLSSNYINEMSEQLVNTSQEMAEALAALRVEDFASIDDYYAEVERVQKEYEERMALQEDELQKAIDNNKELYNQDWTNYHNATGYKISDTEKFATTFKDTLLGALLDSESDAANFTDILNSATVSLTTSLLDAAATYYTNLDNAMQAAGTSTGGFAEDTKANIEAIVDASATGAEAIDQMATEMTEAFGAITDSITTWQQTYGVAMQDIIQSNEDVIQSFNEMMKALSIDANSVTVTYDILRANGEGAEQFDTGGYTGEWGHSGRVAVVHEKELILNKDDTANFLSAIKITRSILETIDLNAKQASMGVGSLTASTVKDDQVQTLEQEVHITAEFPNVNDHNEIEEALRNLMNTASQYANRK